MKDVKLSIIIPLYNEDKNIVLLYDEIIKCLKSDFLDFDYEIIFVNDGSTDDSRDKILDLQKIDRHVIAINLQRNYGQSTALQVGFENCGGDLVITLDGDGQNNPKDMKKLYDKMQKENLDVVAGWRINRKDNLSIKIITKCAKFFRRMLINDKIHDSGCTLRIYKKECVNNLHLRGEMHRYIVEMLAIKGYKVGEVEVDHRARIHGKSKYNCGKSAKGFIDLLYIWFIAKYQSRPLHLFGGIGLASFLIGLFSFLFSIYQKIWQGLSINRSGWFLIGVFLIQTGIMIFIFGIVIDILIRNYYNTSNEMRYIIKEIKNAGN